LHDVPSEELVIGVVGKILASQWRALSRP
jgi:hypothetical protein